MAQYVAGPVTDDCMKGVKHTGEAKGEIIDIADIKAYLSYPPSKSTDKIILFYTDVFGPHFINNKLVMDFFAEHGYLVIAPDYFNGDQLEELRDKPGFDMQKWAAPYRAAAPGIVEKFVPAVKEKFGGKKYAAVGYCFGATYVLKALQSDIADAGAVAHPTVLTEEDLKAVKKPLLFSCAETDRSFPPDKRHRAEEIVVESKIHYHFQLFSGVVHGFAIKADINNENERWAKEQSAWGILAWFDRFLK